MSLSNSQFMYLSGCSLGIGISLSIYSCMPTTKAVTVTKDTMQTAICIMDHELGTPVEKVLFDCEGAIEKNVIDIFNAKRRTMLKSKPQPQPQPCSSSLNSKP